MAIEEGERGVDGYRLENEGLTVTFDRATETDDGWQLYFRGTHVGEMERNYAHPHIATRLDEIATTNG